MTHDDLCALAGNWLRSKGFGVVLKELRACVDTGECPDVIGWRGAVSTVIECKASRADFLADRRKPFRLAPDAAMGDWRFYLCPQRVAGIDDLQSRWGLLHAIDGRVVEVSGVPGNCQWQSNAPFSGAKRCELQIMYSAMTRKLRLANAVGIEVGQSR